MFIGIANNFCVYCISKVFMKKKFNQPNLNAPRFRPKWKKVMSISLYEEFIREFPEHSSISYADFKEIVKVFNRSLVEGIIDNQKGVELPERLGMVFVANCTWGKGKKDKNIDFGKSRELGVVVHHQNWESNHKLMKIFYSNFDNKFRILHKKIWQFRLSKPNRRIVSEGYKKNPDRYVTIHDKQKVSGVFEDFLREHRIKEKGKVVPKDYDEFNMD